MQLQDSLGRPLRDLRISITDRCNFRCTYCMPRENFGPEHVFLEKEEILSYEEMASVVASLIPLGLAKVRITGGEPLLRRDLSVFIAMLRELDSELDIALTTNAVLLERHAESLLALMPSIQICFKPLLTAEIPLKRSLEELRLHRKSGSPSKSIVFLRKESMSHKLSL